MPLTTGRRCLLPQTLVPARYLLERGRQGRLLRWIQAVLVYVLQLVRFNRQKRTKEEQKMATLQTFNTGNSRF